MYHERQKAHAKYEITSFKKRTDFVETFYSVAVLVLVCLNSFVVKT